MSKTVAMDITKETVLKTDNLTYEEAQVFLEQGLKVARIIWIDKTFCYCPEANFVDDVTLTPEDLEATDWYLVEDETTEIEEGNEV